MNELFLIIRNKPILFVFGALILIGGGYFIFVNQTKSVEYYFSNQSMREKKLEECYKIQSEKIIKDQNCLNAFLAQEKANDKATKDFFMRPRKSLKNFKTYKGGLD